MKAPHHLTLCAVFLFLCTLLSSARAMAQDHEAPFPDEATCLADMEACRMAVHSVKYTATNLERRRLANKMCAASDVEGALERCAEHAGEGKPAYDVEHAIMMCQHEARESCKVSDRFDVWHELILTSEQDCDRGDGQACLRAALLHAPDFVTPAPLEVAVLYPHVFHISDPHDWRYGKSRARSLLESAPHAFPELERSVGLAKQSCALGVQDGCSIVESYYPDEVIRDHSNEAIEGYTTQCERGEPGACKVMIQAAWIQNLGLLANFPRAQDKQSEPLRMLRKGLGDALATSCEEGVQWSCDLLARAALLNPNEALFALPANLDTLARAACRTKAGKKLCLVKDMDCFRNPAKCSQKRKRSLLTKFTKPCKKGSLEACHAAAHICHHGGQDLENECPSALPDQELLTTMCTEDEPLMCQSLLNLPQDAIRLQSHVFWMQQFNPYRGREAERWEQWEDRVMVASSKSHLTRCEQRGECPVLSYDRRLISSDDDDVPARYREAIKTQCLTHQRSCEVWIDHYPKSEEEWIKTRDTVLSRCQAGHATSCELALLKLRPGEEHRRQAEARVCELRGDPACSWLESRALLDECESTHRHDVCKEALERSPTHLFLSPKRLYPIQHALCWGGSRSACKSLYSSYQEQPLRYRRDAYLKRCLDEGADHPSCRDAVIATSGMWRVREFEQACHEQDELIACQALAVISRGPAFRPHYIIDTDVVRGMKALKKACSLHHIDSCDSFYSTITRLITTQSFSSLDELHEHLGLMGLFVEQEVTRQLATRACVRGSNAACHTLSMTSVFTDLSSIMLQGCEATLDRFTTYTYHGLPSPCAHVYEQDSAALMKHFRSACTSTDTIEGCQRYEELLSRLLSAQKLPLPLLAEPIARGCNEGVLADCFALSFHRESRSLLTKETVTRFEELCQRKNVVSRLCNRLDEPTIILSRHQTHEDFMETGIAKCLAGGHCQKNIIGQLASRFYHSDREHMEVFYKACAQGNYQACQVAISYLDPNFYPEPSRKFQGKRREGSAQDLLKRDELIEAACEVEPEGELCHALRGIQALRSEDDARRREAFDHLFAPCMMLARNQIDGEHHYEPFPLPYTCTLLDGLASRLELDEATESRLAALLLLRKEQLWLMKDFDFSWSWIHPVARSVLENHRDLEDFLKSTRREEEPLRKKAWSKDNAIYRWE